MTHPARVEREASSFFASVMVDLVAQAESHADSLRRAGRWSILRQMHLDGLKALCAEMVDCDIGFLAHLAYRSGLTIDFSLVKPDPAAHSGDLGSVAG